MNQFWHTGIPWNLVDKAIDNNNFSYNVSDRCKAQWIEATGLSWDTPDKVKVVKCPRCSMIIHIPWTTCGLPEDRQQQLVNLEGTGWADNNLQHPCPSCSTVICKELLSVAKFVENVKALLGPGARPMPGTILDPKAGTPGTMYPGPYEAHTFPNRLLKSGCNSIRSRMTILITNSTWSPTMEYVRGEIEAIIQNPDHLKTINGVASRYSTYTLPVTSRIAVRKMMSRYWENFSMFALDLSGAVMRQGVFVEKMVKLDWLHSPSARDTMERLITKYGKFFQLMALNSGQIAVPTLDIDLAWHTHQLSPSKYYSFSNNITRRFVDHDDKIDETVLSKQFEWTSKLWQEKYGEVYTECTCWYCEGMPLYR